MIYAKRLKIFVLSVSFLASAAFFLFPFHVIDLSIFDFYASKDNLSTIERLVIMAEKGNANAQRRLAYKYDHGLGVDEDSDKAFQLCLKAAKQGDAKAQNNLGVHYQTGRGVEKDYESAIEWYIKASENGNKLAQRNLADLFFELDRYEDAFSWYLKAAERSDVHSQNFLCYMYGHAVGVERDFEQAISWCQKSANRNDPWALHYLAGRFENGEGVARDYKKAFEYYSKSADLGYAPAQYSVAYFYFHSLGVDQDFKEAGYWFGSAANKEYKSSIEYIDAQINACKKSKLYNDQRLKSCMMAAGAGNAEAQNILAYLYRKGLGVEKDMHEALVWYLVYINQKYRTHIEDDDTKWSYWTMRSYLNSLNDVDRETILTKAAEYSARYASH